MAIVPILLCQFFSSAKPFNVDLGPLPAKTHRHPRPNLIVERCDTVMEIPPDGSDFLFLLGLQEKQRDTPLGGLYPGRNSSKSCVRNRAEMSDE